MNSYFKYLFTKRVYSRIHPFLFCFFFLFTSILPVQATYYFNAELEAAYREILELKTAEANQRLAKEQIRDPQNGITVYLLSLSETTQLISTENIEQYQAEKDSESAYIKLLNSNNLPSSPYHRFCLAEVRIQWAFTKIRFNDAAAAAIGAKQALGLLNDNLKFAPAFVPTKKSLGLLNVCLGSIPGSYTWVTSTLGFKGDVRVGMEMIQQVIDSRSIYFQEASLIKIIAEQYILNRDSNVESIKQLHLKYPDNILYSYLYGSILSKSSQSEKALAVIEEIPEADVVSLPMIDYLHGELLLQHGMYPSCRVYLNRFLSNFKGKNLVKDTYFKLFLSYWLSNDTENAMNYWNAIPTVGQTTFESDKYAQKIVNSNELPNKQLTKIRLYTDGGLYTKGFEIFNLTNLSDFTSKKDKIEYFYRAGRLYQKSGKELECISYYEKVISLSSSQKNNYYFAPNSALQLGYINVRMKNTERAKYYFTLAISYKNHEYENSIEQKAKIALNEIK